MATTVFAETLENIQQYKRLCLQKNKTKLNISVFLYQNIHQLLTGFSFAQQIV
jgi:hypothetical protein